MNRDTAVTHRRPVTVWLAVALLAVLAFLSAVGAYLFNLSSADEAVEVVVGLVFVALAAAYLLAGIRLPSGEERYLRLAIGLAVVHGLFNAVIKVGIEGETESMMFVVLTLAVVGLLMLPHTRRFFASSPRPA